MDFRRLIYSAIWIGFVAGLILTVSQITFVSPIIYAAEAYEFEPDDGAAANHEHKNSTGDVYAVKTVERHHGEDEWAPKDGAERTGYSVLSNILAAVGFAAVMLSLMNLFETLGKTQIDVKKGLMWGITGFAVFFVIPGLGLPPEIPGTEAATIENRQLWWLLAVFSGAVSAYLLVFAKAKLKGLAIVTLALPFIFGAPHISGPMFAHPNEQIVTRLTNLHQQFILATSASNLVFWLVLGAICAWALVSFKGQTKVKGASGEG